MVSYQEIEYKSSIDYKYESTSRYIKFPFGSQDIDVSDILEVSL